MFAPRKKSTYRQVCSVEGCESRSDKNLTLSFHRFPRPNERIVTKQNIFGNSEKLDLFKAWQIALKITNVTSKTRVCSLHFEKSTDYLFADVQAKHRVLKRNSVPSRNLPVDSRKKMNEERDEARFLRLQKRTTQIQNLRPEPTTTETDESPKVSVKHENNVWQDETEAHCVFITMSIKKEEAEEEENNAETNDSIQKPEEQVICKESEVQDNVNKAELKKHVTSEDALQQFLKSVFLKTASPEPLVKHAEVQVNPDCFAPSFIKSIKTDSQLHTVTGLESFKILNTIVEIIKTVCGDKYEHLNRIMNTKDRVIMTYMKLKHNLSYSFISVLFSSYSAKHCQRIFDETIKLLGQCLQAAVPWPSREEISKNLPKCFDGFENVRVVLDCTEISVHKSANVTSTCKVMIGVSPAGVISYVSEAYDKKETDSTIFQQSSLIQLLQPGDSVMTDHGFLIDQVCKVNQWKCIRPPLLKDKKQISNEELNLISKIAAARVPIKKLNRKIKTFKILTSVLPTTLVPLVRDIFVVICGTINMSAPILSDSEFMNAVE